MAGEIEKINEIFRIHDEKKKQDDQEKQLKENTAPQEAPEAKKNTKSHRAAFVTAPSLFRSPHKPEYRGPSAPPPSRRPPLSASR